MDEKTLTIEAYNQAKIAGACDKFKKTNNPEKAIADMFSHQGCAFCVNNQIPDILTFRKLKELGVEKYGLYVDAGDIELENPEKAVIIGKTNCTLIVNGNTFVTIILLHGATLHVISSDHAKVVVHGINEKGQLKFEKYGTSQIMAFPQTSKLFKGKELELAKASFDITKITK